MFSPWNKILILSNLYDYFISWSMLPSISGVMMDPTKCIIGVSLHLKLILVLLVL